MLYDWHTLSGELNAEEAIKVAEFSAQMIAAPTAEAAKSLVKQALSTLAGSEDPDGMDKLFGTILYLRKHGSVRERQAVEALIPVMAAAGSEIDAEKVAAEMPPMPAGERYESAGSAKSPLHYMALMSAAAPFLMHATRVKRRDAAVGSSINSILAEHPELRDDPHASRYFDVLKSFAPDVAANPMLAGNVMKSLHQVGPGSVTPKVVRELIDFQEANQKRMGVSGEALRNFAMVAGGLAKRP